MSGESDDVDRLAQSIADGAPIDWDAIDQLPADARLRRLFALLQMVDEVGEVHRSLGDPSHSTHHLDPATTSRVDAPTDPDNVGRWGHLVLRRKIGEGGFGEVYHAHDTWLDHPVALKLFKRSSSGRHSTDRILHEARKLARIRHPNVVTVHGADSHEGRVGFWMDLIEGTTLEHVVQGRRLSAGEAAYIGQDVCKALAAVHRTGIIHRDIKAQNVMRAAEDGRIILMDFGAGEFIVETTANPSRQGTPAYLAPEVFESGTASVRSDIYAVGVLMYFLVTGNFPVNGSSVAKLVEAHRRGERGRLRDGRPDLPYQFVTTIERALDPDPVRRFASAGELESALGGSIQAVPVHVAAPGLIDRKTEHTVVQKVSIGAAIALISTVMIGWIACRMFDTAVGVPPDFAADPVDYLYVGTTALAPFGIFWALAAVGLAIGASTARPLRKRFARFVTRIRASRKPADGATVATFVLAAAAGCWLVISWQYADVFNAMGRLATQVLTVDELSTMGPAKQSLHRAHYLYSAYLTLLLSVVVWWWFPRLEQNTSDPDRVRLLKWATVVVIALVIASAALPWRLVWERFEVVTFENRSAFVIGSNSDELLLYYPYDAAPKHRRVRRDARTLQRTGAQAKLFDRQ
jgi:hypothetical protein